MTAEVVAAQLSLLDDAGRVHKVARGTERDAAGSMRPHTERLRVRVLQLLREYPEGLTDDEGGRLLGGDRLTFGRRRQELTLAGVVHDSGIRRQTPSGRSAIVWRARAGAARGTTIPRPLGGAS